MKSMNYLTLHLCFGFVISCMWFLHFVLRLGYDNPIEIVKMLLSSAYNYVWFQFWLLLFLFVCDQVHAGVICECTIV